MNNSPEDFPQIWEKPPFEDLIACLESLQIRPRVWSSSAPHDITPNFHESTARSRQEITTYLSGITSSSLRWINDEEKREQLWEEASKRLSERCGRAGMGDITRQWHFPSEEGAHEPFELVVREPTITGDSLGLKTWGSSYLLAGQLDKVAAESLGSTLPLCRGDSSASVLELGSGTGLLGLAAAAIWKTSVALSDMPNIMGNLTFNMDKNRDVIENLGGHVIGGALTWGAPLEENDALFAEENQFKIVLIADPLYDDNHPSLLSSAVEKHLSKICEARLVVMVPLRDPTTRRLLSEFQSKLMQHQQPLACLEEHTLFGQDDWGEDEEPTQLECWWGVYGRSLTR